MDITYGSSGVPTSIGLVANSGYTIGNLQWDFGQNPSAASSLVTAASAYLKSLGIGFSSPESDIVLALTVHGKALSGNPSAGLNLDSVNGLNAFLSSHTGQVWVNGTTDNLIMNGDLSSNYGNKSLVAVAYEVQSILSSSNVTFSVSDVALVDAIGMKIYNQGGPRAYNKFVAYLKNNPNDDIKQIISKATSSSNSELNKGVRNVIKIVRHALPGNGDVPGYAIRCFPGFTTISMFSGMSKPISDLRIGDTVLAFNPTADLGRGALVPRRVTRLFRNSTTEWIKLTWVDPASGEAKELVATPGHNMLDKFGRFTRLDALVAGNTCELVLASGDCIMAQAQRLVYSAATADMFERATAMAATSGALAIAPHALDAWATYNFEVEDLHTYVAGGVRVHNDSLYAPVTDLGRLGDNVASQISDFAFGKNTLGSVFAGSALRSVLSTLGDVYDPKAAASGYQAASFDVPHLAGRYIADVAGGLGAIGGSLLAQDLVSGLGIRGPLADALVQFGSGAGSLLAQEAALKNVLIPTSEYNFHLQHAKAHAKNVNRELTTLRAGAFWFTQTLAA
jgi:hypothetical protein